MEVLYHKTVRERNPAPPRAFGAQQYSFAFDGIRGVLTK
jgi:hypothetical protein